MLFITLIVELITLVPCPVVYADDFPFVVGRESILALQRVLKWNFINLWKAARRMELVINMSKTKLMLVRERIDSRRFSETAFELPDHIDGGGVIECVTKFKYIGVILDKVLKFYHHVESVADNVNRTYRALEGGLKMKGLNAWRRVWMWIYKALMCGHWLPLP